MDHNYFWVVVIGTFRIFNVTVDLRSTRISSFAMDEFVGWLVKVSLMFFAFTGSARLWKGVNAKIMRANFHQPAHGLIK